LDPVVEPDAARKDGRRSMAIASTPGWRALGARLLAQGRQALWHGLQHGSRCVLCAAGGAREGLCPGCRADLPWLAHPACPVCAAPLAEAARCGACIAQPPAFTRTVAALEYAFPAAEMIQRFKFDGALWLAPPLAALLCAVAGEADRPDVLLPMPLAQARLAQRGFNQCAEIARYAARALAIDCRPELLRRVRDSAPQAARPLSERAANVRGAFVVDRPVGALHIALIDDVLTTGATANAAARALLGEGARRVDVWVIARTLRRAGD
jgi:ComF family protein